MKEPKDESARGSGVLDLEREEGDPVALKDPAIKKGAFRGDKPDRLPDIIPAEKDEAWFRLSQGAQRTQLEKIMGTYRPLRTAKTVNREAAGYSDLLRPWTLRGKGDGPADALLKVPKPKKPKRSKVPLAAPVPTKGTCWHCTKELPRFGLQDGAKFCSIAHRNAFNYREAQRDKADRLLFKQQQSKHPERMLSIHHLAADALSNSAARLGIDATFTPTADGVLAVHTNALPPIASCLGDHLLVRVVAGEGHATHPIGVAATDVDGGTLYEFEINRLEGDAVNVFIKFAGDPGPAYVGNPDRTRPPAILNARQAILTNRVAEYLRDRGNALAA